MDLLTPTHLIIVLVIALLLFGPKRLPEIGKGVGKTIQEFRRSVKDIDLTQVDASGDPAKAKE